MCLVRIALPRLARLSNPPPPHPAAPDPPPLVSVIVPARDAAATLARAIASVLAQDYAPMEIVVVDDASRDATAAIAERCAAEGARAGVPVRLIRLAAPQGAAAARNAGVAAAAGEVIAFQDADDEWLPGKLARQMAVLREPGTVFVACGARLVSVDGQDLGPLFGGQIPAAGTAAWRGLLARNTIATPCVAVWRRDLLAVGGFDAALPVAEDQDLWIRLSLHGRLGYVDAHLVWVHMTAISVSGVGTGLGARQQMQITLPMIRRHLAAQRHRLSRGEIRAILGERLCRAGRSAYSFGLYRQGAAMVLAAAWYGFEPLRNLLFLASASPPGRWLKRQVRR